MKLAIPITRVLSRGSPFFSFIIGLGLAVLVYHRQYDVIKTLAVPVKEAMDRVVKADGKCYRYRVEDAECEIPSSS
jgi:hypothetical protein